MIIYLDNEFKCHISNDGTMIEFETDFFNGKCAEFIEGYRFIPNGETWVRSDGITFIGEMISPWKPYKELDTTQREYENEQYLASLEKDEQYTQAYNEGVQEA